MPASIQHNGDHMILEYETGRRPSAIQIVGEWHKQGRPRCFEVGYGETFALFQRVEGRRIMFGDTRPATWHDSGNGGSGVKRNEVVKILNALETFENQVL